MLDEVRIAGRRGRTAAAAIIAAAIAGVALPSAGHSQDSSDLPPKSSTDPPPQSSSDLPPPLFDPKVPSASMVAYRKRIFEIISQNKSHLRDQRLHDAVNRGEQGLAIVAFRLDRNGHLLDSHIFQSSGSATLDQVALDIVKQSQPFPPLPSDYAKPETEIKAPFNFVTGGLSKPELGRLGIHLWPAGDDCPPANFPFRPLRCVPHSPWAP